MLAVGFQLSDTKGKESRSKPTRKREREKKGKKVREGLLASSRRYSKSSPILFVSQPFLDRRYFFSENVLSPFTRDNFNLRKYNSNNTYQIKSKYKNRNQRIEKNMLRICYSLTQEHRLERIPSHPLFSCFPKTEKRGLVGAQLSNYFPTWMESRLPLSTLEKYCSNRANNNG